MRLQSFHRWLAPACAALALAGCATTAPRPEPPRVVVPARPASPAATVCTTCGRIERIDVAAASGAATPRGAVLGGVVGGVLARPAPAAASGANAPSNAARSYRVVVLLDNGRRLILTQALAPGMKVGSRVRVDRSRAVLLR